MNFKLVKNTFSLLSEIALFLPPPQFWVVNRDEEGSWLTVGAVLNHRATIKWLWADNLRFPSIRKTRKQAFLPAVFNCGFRIPGNVPYLPTGLHGVSLGLEQRRGCHVDLGINISWVSPNSKSPNVKWHRIWNFLRPTRHKWKIPLMNDNGSKSTGALEITHHVTSRLSMWHKHATQMNFIIRPEFFLQHNSSCMCRVFQNLKKKLKSEILLVFGIKDAQCLSW